MSWFRQLLTAFMAVTLTSVAIAAEADFGNINRLGERMYRDGLLSSGLPMKGYVKGDVEVDSTVFSCANCHTRSGLGSVEGQITSPPINGVSLFKPRYLFKDQIKNSISKSRGINRKAEELRPAYTEKTVADALRGGVDPNGREFVPIMPRYNLNDHDMKIMIDYLQNLSSALSPGVTEKSITFATIVTDDVTPADRQAMMASMETLVAINQQTKTQRQLPQFAKMFRMLDTAFFRDLSIKVWQLKGDQSTWKTQLETYYKKEPVFAILGGISNKPWQPIHDFCEANQIPCLFPITDMPVISDTSWYTYYSSKGYYQEGETAARYMNRRIADVGIGKILQIVSDTPESKMLADGFTRAWREAGRNNVQSINLTKNINATDLLNILRKHSPENVLIWSDNEIISALTEMPPDTKLPHIFVSSRYVGKTFTRIPEYFRDNIFITYPFRMPDDEKNFKGYQEFLTLGKLKKPDEKRIATRTFSMIHIFLQGLKELKLDFYRDTLLDVLAMRPDQYLPDFERYSFGPGQRYASKGCYVVQLGKGTAPKLVRKNDWVSF